MGEPDRRSRDRRTRRLLSYRLTVRSRAVSPAVEGRRLAGLGLRLRAGHEAPQAAGVDREAGGRQQLPAAGRRDPALTRPTRFESKEKPLLFLAEYKRVKP